MKARQFIAILGSILLFCVSCTAKKDILPITNGVLVKGGDTRLKVQFYGEGIVRVVKWTEGGRENKRSLSVVVDSLPAVELSSRQEGHTLFLESGKLKLALDLKNDRIEFKDASGKTLLQEGASSFSPVVYRNDSAFSCGQKFLVSELEGHYGLGQHQSGYMNYRGKQVLLAQSNTEAVNPFLISTLNYGILWDNYSKTIYSDEGKNTISLWSEVGDNMDYYFVAGKNMDEVISGYRFLTGPAPLYGKWAYGYWQSKEHYDTQAELMTVAEKYRQLKMPIDNIIQDWDYWNGTANWGSMQFDSKLFPDPSGMVKRLHQMNYHMMISIWPAVGPNTAVYKDMLAKGFLYPPVGWAGFKYYDAYNPAANALYWEYLKKGLVSTGIDAWWMDSTEPDVINALTKESSDYELKKMDNNFLGSFARYLNPYSLVMTENIYKNWRKDQPDRRCYILTRSTFAGQQRYAATTWSGDIGANWQVYRKQISAGINHGMSGIPYWTFDIGCFVIGAYEGVFNTGGKNPAYQEFYTRMFQFGAFAPIFRSHGSETPREIWEMGDFTKPILKYDHLRYRLLPYIYSLAWKVTNEGYTMMRGLPMDFTSDKKTYAIDDQYMFGPAFLVNPVTEYMYHCPPQASVLIAPEYFRTPEGKQGLLARYYSDNKYKNLTREQVDSCIDIFWYTGRPAYVTDSMYAIRWEGNLIPKESGKHQFHMKCFDAKRIFLDGKQLPVVYTSTEQYTEILNLEAGKEYKIVVETENTSTGAARFLLFWKTPSIFAAEASTEVKAKTRKLYLPAGNEWINFWTGEKLAGGQEITTDAPIDIMPLFVRTGSIVPMGPFLQYSTEKPADPLELRIYRGDNGNFVLYEDENDNYNYEKGVYSTIRIDWDDKAGKLTIGKRNGEFPGMLKTRTFQLVLVSKDHGTGLEIVQAPDKTVSYTGNELVVQF